MLVTHAHPDHYGGLVELGDVPIYAVAGVADVIRRDDDAKEQILRPMFGDEWPRERAFPNRIVAGGERLSLAGLEFTVLDLGPGESPHDSLWLLGDDRRTVFSGDQFYNHMHAYLADGFHEQWLEHIATLRGELPGDALLHPGHGDPAGPELLDWQARLHPHVRGRGPARRLVRPRAGQGIRGRSGRRVPAERATCGS